LAVAIFLIGFATIADGDQLRVGRQFPSMRFDNDVSSLPLFSGKKTVAFVYASW